MRPQVAPVDVERQILAWLEKSPQGKILALVHSVLPSAEARRSFEHARATLSHTALVALAARTLAERGFDDFPRASRSDEASGVRRLPSSVGQMKVKP
jgi:hypothetical protein